MLLYIASSSDRAVLLEMLEGAMEGGALREDLTQEEIELDTGSIELGSAVEVAGEDYYGDALDLDEEDVDGPEIVLDSGEVIGPHTPMRITPEGEEMLFVAFSLERWLANAPSGPLELGIGDAGLALASLVCNWSATVMHALAPGPRTLPELNEAVVPLGYETLEEHIDAMERAGQVEAQTDSTGATRYAATQWLREGIAPIAAAARLERHFPSPDTLPPDSLDVGAGFLLTLPLLQLPKHLSGSSRLGVKLSEDGFGGPMVGVTAQVADGRVIWCDQHLEKSPDSWATGTSIEWLDTLVQPAVRRIDTGGEKRLADALVEALHEKLFGVPVS